MDEIKKANLLNPEIKKAAIYNNGEVAFINNLTQLHAAPLTHLTLKMEVVVAVLVLEGKASIDINGKRYDANKNDLFVCTPDLILKNTLSSIDFKCYCVIMSPDYLTRILPVTERSWDIRRYLDENPVHPLLPEEAAVFRLHYQLICARLQLPSPIQTKVIDTLILALIYDMRYALERIVQSTPRPYSTSQHLFDRFVSLLENTQQRPRRVKYYADKLNVTPKYLSCVCKELGGATASCIIDLYVKKDVDRMLKFSPKSIKEISNELGFDNLSFFGKYVRKHFGMSPKAYRAQSQDKPDTAG